MDRDNLKKLFGTFGGAFSRELGIDLSGADPKELFKWLLASKLFGARISSTIAAKTYKAFASHGATTPEAILSTGWDGLVRMLDEGGYVRYDFSTATRLLEISGSLIKLYGGDLNRLHDEAGSPEDLEERLKNLGKGIGDITVNIFLRELRGVWKKADPQVSGLVRLAAEDLRILKRVEKDPLNTLKEYWSRNKVRGFTFVDFEAALLKLGKDFCKKSKKESCPMKDVCSR